MKRLSCLALALTVLIGLVGCGGEQHQPGGTPTKVEMTYGIGPIRNVQLGPINQQMAQQGEQIFRGECMKCHMLDKSVLGPPLRDVANRRTPEFIMNMILNPSENVTRQPSLQKYQQQYSQSMAVTGIDSSGARKVLEYLRSVAPDTTS